MAMTFSPLVLQSRSSVLSIDLEDWFALRHRHTTGTDIEVTSRVLQQTENWLRWLEQKSIRATFFCLGTVARKYPDLIRRIHSQGHEIASHGNAHFLTKDISESQFRLDIQTSLDVLQSITGEKVLGYRAPQFWIRNSQFEPLEILAELGLEYDSSIYPMKFRKYGWPDFPTQCTQIKFANNQSIVEFPLTTTQVFGVELPVSGGGYFRLLPARLVRNLWKRTTANPLMIYFHPYEVSDVPLRLADVGLKAPFWKRLRMEFPQNLGRGSSLLNKLEAVGHGFCYRSCKEVLNEIKSAERSQGSRRVL